MTQTKTATDVMTTFKVWLKGGEVVTIEAQSEKHARQAISRGRKVGRYSGRVVRVERVKSSEQFNMNPAATHSPGEKRGD